jgi:hypothetical protein
VNKSRYLLLVAAAVPVGLAVGGFLSTHFAAPPGPRVGSRAAVYGPVATPSPAGTIASAVPEGPQQTSAPTPSVTAQPAASPAPPVRTDIALTAAQGAAYVRAVYADALDHEPGADVVERWAATVRDGSSRAQFAAGVVASVDWQTHAVDDLFQQLLGRAAGATAAGNFASAAGDGAAVDAAQVTVVASDEYYTRSGSSDERWVRALYRDALGREPDTGSMLSLVAFMHFGGDRATLARNVLTSPEHRSRAVGMLFQKFLGRPPSAAELAWFVSATPWQSEAFVTAQLIASDEYVRRHTAT